MRRSLDRFNADDLDGFLADIADDAEVWPAPSFPEGGPYRGRDKIRSFYAGLRDGLKTGTTVTPREIEAAADKVFVSFEWRAIGESSGLEASSNWYLVTSYRDGRAVRVEFFTDRDLARRAAGLKIARPAPSADQRGPDSGERPDRRV